MTQFNPFSLKGKRILITGASSGIGRQTAISCSSMGGKITIVGRDAVRLAETFASLEGQGHSIIQADLQNAEDITKIVLQAGVLDGLVHAAGIVKLVPFRMMNQKHLDEMFSVNVYAPLLLTKSLLVKKQIVNGASILFIGAIASRVGPVASAAYSASKAALFSAMRSLALEVLKQKIRVNIISPGYVRTPMFEKLTISGGEVNDRAALAPLGIGDPVDIANAIIFYLSNASSWVTRTEFVVDGGLTISINI